MAGSGPYAPIGDGYGPYGGGWLSGSGSWFDKHRERKEKFLAAHPDWEIVYVRSQDRYEASTGNTDTELVIMTDTHLGTLMDRLEKRFSIPEEPQG
jgi:hypothetical protein